MTLLQKVEQTIDKFAMLQKNDRVVLAISGGPDSVALLYLLRKLQTKLSLRLHLAHLNHCLRKGESEADSLFVQKLAQKVNLPVTIEKRDVKGYARENRLSLEEAARILRYGFLCQAAKENRAGKIALGHNKDDQAETVLMRFLRGSGISGLRAIPAVRDLPGTKIIRPLIEISREEIGDFLAAKKIPFRNDSSNRKDIFLRNRVRNKLLPLLEKEFNPNMRETLVNFAENISDDCDYIQKISAREFAAVRAPSPSGKVALKTRKFALLHKALQKLITRAAIKELKGDTRKIDYRHWKELEKLAFQRPKNSIVDLPEKISVVNSGEKLIFYRRAAK